LSEKLYIEGMKVISNKYIVRVESSVTDHFVTKSGNKFYKDLTLGNKEWNRQTKGTVVYVPEKHVDHPVRKTKMAMAGKVFGFDMMAKVIQPGDEVWFNYLSCQPANRVILPNHKPSDFLYILSPDEIHAYSRNGQFRANVGRCICEPISEDKKLETQLIIPESFSKSKGKSFAKVLSVGKPWKGFGKTGISKGDIVVFDSRETDWLDEQKTMFSVYHQAIHLIVRP